jgi:hypothetical protein
MMKTMVNRFRENNPFSILLECCGILQLQQRLARRWIVITGSGNGVGMNMPRINQPDSVMVGPPPQRPPLILPPTNGRNRKHVSHFSQTKHKNKPTPTPLD